MHFVYLVSPEGKNVYKVGETIDIEKRFSRKEKEKDYKLTLIYAIPVNHEYAWFIEKSIHNHFSRYRLAGDWFALTPEQVESFPDLVRCFNEVTEGERNE